MLNQGILCWTLAVTHMHCSCFLWYLEYIFFSWLCVTPVSPVQICIWSSQLAFIWLNAQEHLILISFFKKLHQESSHHFCTGSLQNYHWEQLLRCLKYIQYWSVMFASCTALGNGDIWVTFAQHTQNSVASYSWSCQSSLIAIALESRPAIFFIQQVCK